MKNKITRDYHGVLLEDAIRDLERLLWYQCDPYQEYNIELITGREKIKNKIINFLMDYDYAFYCPMKNDGIIIIEL